MPMVNASKSAFETNLTLHVFDDLVDEMPRTFDRIRFQ